MQARGGRAAWCLVLGACLRARWETGRPVSCAGGSLGAAAENRPRRRPGGAGRLHDECTSQAPPPSAPPHWPTPACLRACVTAVVADAAAGRQRIIFGGTIVHCRVRSGSRIGPACRPDHMDLSDCISTSGMRGPRDRPPSAVLRHGQGPAARHGPLALAIHCPVLDILPRLRPCRRVRWSLEPCQTTTAPPFLAVSVEIFGSLWKGCSPLVGPSARELQGSAAGIHACLMPTAPALYDLVNRAPVLAADWPSSCP